MTKAFTNSSVVLLHLKVHTGTFSRMATLGADKFVKSSAIKQLKSLGITTEISPSRTKAFSTGTSKEEI